MKQIQLRVEPDPSLDHSEVLIHAPEEDGQVKALLRRLSGSAPATLTVFDSIERQHLLRAEDIVSVSADGKQVRIVTEGELFYLRQTMRSVEETLDPQRFVRI